MKKVSNLELGSHFNALRRSLGGCVISETTIFRGISEQDSEEQTTLNY